MSDIPWYLFERRKMPPSAYTVERARSNLVAVPKTHYPAERIGTVYAPDREDAMRQAREVQPDPKVKVDVVARASWLALTRIEREVFLGTFEPPVERRVVVEVPSGGVCRTCGCEIPRGRTGRPRTYCDRHVPPELERSRRYQAMQQGRLDGTGK